MTEPDVQPRVDRTPTFDAPGVDELGVVPWPILLRRRIARRVGIDRRWAVLWVVLGGLFTVSFTVTILVVSLQRIADDLDSSVGVLNWAITGPMLAPLSGVPTVVASAASLAKASASAKGCSAGSANSRSASGSMPASRAISPLLRRLGLYGRYRSSSSCLVAAASMAARSRSYAFSAMHFGHASTPPGPMR